MVTLVEKSTIPVFTVKLALMEPAGTVTLDGTLATPLLLESAICAPPEGAGPLKVTVPVEESERGPTVARGGFSVGRASVGGGGGVTVSEAVCVTPPKDAEMVTEVDAATALVVTVNVAEVAPAGTVTLEGTCATVVSLLDSETCRSEERRVGKECRSPGEAYESPTNVAGLG